MRSKRPRPRQRRLGVVPRRSERPRGPVLSSAKSQRKGQASMSKRLLSLDARVENERFRRLHIPGSQYPASHRLPGWERESFAATCRGKPYKTQLARVCCCIPRESSQPLDSARVWENAEACWMTPPSLPRPGKRESLGNLA